MWHISFDKIQDNEKVKLHLATSFICSWFIIRQLEDSDDDKIDQIGELNSEPPRTVATGITIQVEETNGIMIL